MRFLPSQATKRLSNMFFYWCLSIVPWNGVAASFFLLKAVSLLFSEKTWAVHSANMCGYCVKIFRSITFVVILVFRKTSNSQSFHCCRRRCWLNEMLAARVVNICTMEGVWTTTSSHLLSLIKSKTIARSLSQSQSIGLPVEVVQSKKKLSLICCHFVTLLFVFLLKKLDTTGAAMLRV